MGYDEINRLQIVKQVAIKSSEPKGCLFYFFAHEMDANICLKELFSPFKNKLACL